MQKWREIRSKQTAVCLLFCLHTSAVCLLFVELKVEIRDCAEILQIQWKMKKKRAEILTDLESIYYGNYPTFLIK